MTPWDGNAFCLIGPLCGESTGFPAQRNKMLGLSHFVLSEGKLAWSFHMIVEWMFETHSHGVLSATSGPGLWPSLIITHAPVHINDFRGVRARYVKRTG